MLFTENLAAARRIREVHHLLAQWANNELGMSYAQIYCRSFLGQELEQALQEAVGMGLVENKEGRYRWCGPTPV